MRVRNKSTVAFAVGTAREYDKYGAHIPSRDVTYTNPVVSPDVMTDLPTPRFRERSSGGEIIISPMSHDLATRIVTGGATATVQGPNNRWEMTGNHAHDGEPLGWSTHLHPDVVAEVDRLRSLAITDAYAEVGKPDLALLTELVELKETLGFLWSPVSGMVSLTKRFKRYLDIVEAIEERFARALKKWESLPPRLKLKRKQPEKPKLPTFTSGKYTGTDVASSWLAYRYGLMPLIYTFQDIEALLKKRAEGAKQRATARARQSGTVNVSSLVTSGTIGYDVGQFKYELERTGAAKISVRAGVLYEPDWSLSSQLGVQWNRVPMALYEGFPLSFVTDWFHNGAAVYDALTAEMRAKKILGAWTVASVTSDVGWSITYLPVSVLTVSGPGTFANYNGKWKERKVASLADVRLKLRVDMNSKRIADGLALIYSFLATANSKRK